jgi:hypothetical protein
VSSRKPNLRSSVYYSETDGQWHGWVTVGVKDDGSADRRHRMAKTQAAVTRKVRELERKRDAGIAGKPGKPPTVADWFVTWLTTIAPRTVAQDTLDSTCEPKVRRWIIPQLGSTGSTVSSQSTSTPSTPGSRARTSSRTPSCRSTGFCAAR